MDIVQNPMNEIQYSSPSVDVIDIWLNIQFGINLILC